MLQEKALSDETTENLMSFTHTRIIQIPCREHCQYQGKRTSVSQLEKLQKIQSPVKTRLYVGRPSRKLLQEFRGKFQYFGLK